MKLVKFAGPLCALALAGCGSSVESTGITTVRETSSAPAYSAPETTAAPAPAPSSDKREKISDPDIARELRTVGVVVTKYTDIGKEEVDAITRPLYDRIMKAQDGVKRAIDDWHAFADPIRTSDLMVPGRLDGIKAYSQALDAWYEQQKLGADIWKVCLDEEMRKPNRLGVEGCIVMDYDYDQEARVFKEYLDTLTALAEDVGLL